MFRLPLIALITTVAATLAGLTIIAVTDAKPTDLLALDPDIVNANTGAACAPACDLTDPADLLAVADADGDGDGRVEAQDFRSLDVDGDQLPATAGTLWVVVFVDADGPVAIDPGLHLRFVEDDLGNMDGELQCDPTATDIADEDCDFDGIPGDGAVVGTLQNRDAVPGDVEQVEAQQEGRFMALAIQLVSEAGTPTPTPGGATGLLRVETSPPVASTISVDGVIRNDWGLDWAELPEGQHEVSFSDVPGFITPDPQAVAVAAGATTDVTGVFLPRAFLRVTTVGWSAGETPTVSVDGEPMNTWGLWVALPPGSYTVSFEDMPGYLTPCVRVVTLTGGATTHVEGDYSDGSCDIVP